MKSGWDSDVENISRAKDVFRVSNGPYLELPDLIVWSKVWVRFVMAFFIDSDDERFLAAGKSGPSSGQLGRAWITVGNKAPKERATVDVLKNILIWCLIN